MAITGSAYQFSHRLRILMAAWLASEAGRTHPCRRHLEQLPQLFALALELVLDARVTRPDRELLLAAIIYVVNPGDFLPEDIVGARGYADDAVVLALVLSRVLQGAPHDLRVDVPLQSIEALATAGPEILGRPLWDRVVTWLDRHTGDKPVADLAGVPLKREGKRPPRSSHQ